MGDQNSGLMTEGMAVWREMWGGRARARRDILGLQLSRRTSAPPTSAANAAWAVATPMKGRFWDCQSPVMGSYPGIEVSLLCGRYLDVRVWVWMKNVLLCLALVFSIMAIFPFFPRSLSGSFSCAGAAWPGGLLLLFPCVVASVSVSAFIFLSVSVFVSNAAAV